MIKLIYSISCNILNEGYQIDSCTNGSDALDKISNNRFDVILLDENMPGISGMKHL